MEDRSFLRQVAEYLAERACGITAKDTVSPDMSSLVAVLPNKRSAMFLKTHLRGVLSEKSSVPAFMPRFITLERLASVLDDGEIMSDDEQLFLLYDCYRRTLRSRGQESRIRPFDRFVYWGRIILSDYESVDTSLADASKIYKNLSDEKEISANYLTEEQKEVIRDIWGETSLTLATSDFWNHIPADSSREKDSISYKFLSFWSVLGELYGLFNKEVTSRGMTTRGLQWRNIALEIIDGLPPCARQLHFAFIGLSDITPAQHRVMEVLGNRGKASFFWDMSGYFTSDAGTSRRFFPYMENLAAHFAMPEDFAPEKPLAAPEISVISVGSRIGQTKLAAGLLRQLYTENPSCEDSHEAPGSSKADGHRLPDTGIIVPDDSLLSPLMLSVPECVDRLNVTIGLSFRQTPLATLIRSILAMQLHSVSSRGQRLFRREIVDEIVSHPLLGLCAPEDTAVLGEFLAGYNFFNIDTDTIRAHAGALAFVFDDYLSAEAYLHTLVTGLADVLARNAAAHGSGHAFEIEILDYLRQNIETLELLADRYHTGVEPATRLRMFDSMLSIRTLNMNGSPLQGLQILGLPEARALDFGNLIILSMNEKIFPRRNFIRSLIPELLRTEFGLPPQRLEEQKYAYSFYRSIGRARYVSLIYDSRTGSFGAGERSRFIEQLLRLHPGLLSTGSARLDASLGKRNEMSVVKTPEILERLESYKTPGGRYVSASSLKNFKACPLKFYLQNVESYYDRAKTEYVTRIDRGNIFHHSLQTIYGALKESGGKVNAERLRAIAGDTDYIGSVVLGAINVYRLRGHEAKTSDALTGDNALSFIDASRCIPDLMRIEADGLGDSWFRVEEVEKEFLTTITIGDNSINLKMIVDRIDRLPDGSLRFIDYKTGDEKASAKTIDSLFTRGQTSHDAMFQLLLYGFACNISAIYPEEIRPVIYCISRLREEPIMPLKIGGKEITSATLGPNGRDGFMAKLTELVSDIFDPGNDFGQTQNNDRCKYCTFLEICGKKSAKEI